jgi:hypothetical protein
LGTSSVPKISLGSRSRLKKWRRGKPWDCKREQETDWRKTHSRMVRFFGGVLSSFMGCFPLSAMALGFSPLEQGEKMWRDGRVCEWICRASRRLFYWLRECIGSDDWLAYVIRIPNDRVFFLNAKGFHWTVFMVPELRIFCGFCAKGQVFWRIWLR